MGEMHDMPGMGMGGAPSELSFEVDFPEPGIYRVWVQYSRGGDVTQSFTLRVFE